MSPDSIRSATSLREPSRRAPHPRGNPPMDPEVVRRTLAQMERVLGH
jgi:hypothetical protein